MPPVEQPLEPVHPNTTLPPEGTQPTQPTATTPPPSTESTTTAAPTTAETKPVTDPKAPKESLLSKDLKPGETPPAEGDAVVLHGAPETYEAFTAPEGYEISADANTRITAAAKELNLSQAGAQKLVELYATEQARTAAEPFEAYDTMREGWQKEVRADPELWAGDALRPEVNSTIGRALDQLDVGRKPGAPSLTEQFKMAMNITGAGDHPAFVKAFYRMAKQITEGRPVTTGNPPPAPGKATGPGANALYPQLPTG